MSTLDLFRNSSHWCTNNDTSLTKYKTDPRIRINLVCCQVFLSSLDWPRCVRAQAGTALVSTAASETYTLMTSSRISPSSCCRRVLCPDASRASGACVLMASATPPDNPPSAVSVRQDGLARSVTSRSTIHVTGTSERLKNTHSHEVVLLYSKRADSYKHFVCVCLSGVSMALAWP